VYVLVQDALITLPSPKKKVVDTLGTAELVGIMVVL
jgi:hypothetical protein